jgi:hypothetical protein
LGGVVGGEGEGSRRGKREAEGSTGAEARRGLTAVVLLLSVGREGRGCVWGVVTCRVSVALAAISWASRDWIEETRERSMDRPISGSRNTSRLDDTRDRERRKGTGRHVI